VRNKRGLCCGQLEALAFSSYQADGSETTWGLDSGTFWIFLHDLDVYYDSTNFLI
jgi:hypothetical protein